MKKIIKIISCLLVAVIGCAVLSGCGGDAVKYAESLSNYTINAVLDDDSKTVSVSQTISYINEYEVELYDIGFKLYPNAYREDAIVSPITSAEEPSAYPNGKSYGDIEITKLEVNGVAQEPNVTGVDENLLLVDLEKSLMPEFRVDIYMEYTLTLPNIRHRFGYYDNTINLGNFYPVASVYSAGEWLDDPYYSNGDPFYSLSANYNVSVTAPSKYAVAMSGDVSSETSGNTTTTQSALLCARDFAVVIGHLNVLKSSVGNTTIYYYYYKDEDPTASLQTCVDSITTFNKLFGEYPYPSYSVVETNFLNGGMEYPGLVYISNELNTSLYNEVIIHETAHQWWYGVVGNDQINEAWLDEALAEYSTTLFYKYNPSYGVEYDDRLADAISGYAMYCDMFKGNINFNTCIERSLYEFSSSLEYTYMTYVKGQVMMSCLHSLLGADTFLQGLKDYYKDNMYGVATKELLIGAFENASQKELASFFDSWLSGKTQVYG